MTYCGDMIPNHFESIIPAYRLEEGQWILSKDMPYPGMIGCDRAVKARVGYLGDSITQGIGTDVNSYEHWNAQLSEKLGDVYSFWNLGIGYGRGADAATDGAWLYKAKHNDLVVVCLGVNDIMQGLSADTIKKALAEILNRLHEAGVKVLLQTVPPFDYDSDRKATWLEVNRYLREELRGKAEGFFDTVPVLGKGGEQSEVAVYGGHPDAVGCKAWAEALYPEVKRLLDLHF
jgi:lysophospholipase L1-like esterase